MPAQQHDPPRSNGIDLSYLERLYKGDRSRMEQWVGIYLEEAPSQFEQLSHSLANGDTQGLISAAHDLRPQAHYVGAPRMLELLISIGQLARTDGCTACSNLVSDLLVVGRSVEAELRAWIIS